MLKIFEGDTLFFLCAMLGTGMFALQILLSTLGVFDDEGAFHEGALKWFSWQALCGFLMMFGWTSLTCFKEFEFSKPLSIIIALFAAVIAVYILGLMLRGMRKLESRGNVFLIENTIGKEAVVYQSISCKKAGKVTLSINDMTCELDAIMKEGTAASFTRVKIVAFCDEKTVIVEPL